MTLSAVTLLTLLHIGVTSAVSGKPVRARSKSQIPLRYPGRRLQVRAGRRPASRCNLAYHHSDLARASRSATSPGPVCDQDSVMEFGVDQLRNGLRPGSSRFELSRHVEIA